jgi:hypothetical protein
MDLGPEINLKLNRNIEIALAKNLLKINDAEIDLKEDSSHSAG